MPVVIDLTNDALSEVIDLTFDDDAEELRGILVQLDQMYPVGHPLDQMPVVKEFEVTDICGLCHESARDGFTYYVPPCGHMHCYDCVKDSRVTSCLTCTQEFEMAVPVVAMIRT